MMYNDYLLTTDDLGVSGMIEHLAGKVTPQELVRYCMKMQKLSEHNLALLKVEVKRKTIQHQRQMKNATYWGMAVDLAKEDLKGGLQ